MEEFNFIIANGNEHESDARIFFQEENIIRLLDNATMLDVAMAAGIFTSRGQAKKAGWAKPIPPGFSQLEAGKLKAWICILNPIAMGVD